MIAKDMSLRSSPLEDDVVSNHSSSSSEEEANESGSGSGSGSDTDSSSHVDIATNGSRKRRKVETRSASSSPEPAAPAPMATASRTSTSISRIKPRTANAVSRTAAAKKVDGSRPTKAPSSLDNGSAVESALSSKTSFASLGVHPWLIAALSAMAITRPTGIQKGCIPEILKGKDCIGGSRTGSGKTMAFAVPILQKWAVDPVGIYAVVLTPTRELALQIYEQFKAISASQNLKPILVTGGADMREQALALSQRPHVVIATPGRLADHISTSGEDTICGLRRARFVVLDEADRLLASGHGSMLPDVETCLSVLPPPMERQTCLFTATVTPEVRALKDSRQQSLAPGAKPQKEVFVCEVDTAVLAIPQTLRQHYLQVPTTHREVFLHILLLTPANISRPTIIFTNRTATATMLEHMLRLLEHRVTSLHSGLAQRQRIDNLSRFRAGAARILVATDVAARGLDIPEVALVINYDVPRDPDDYIHRVGRTARAGRSGDAVTLVGQRDVALVLAIEERVGRKMVEYDEGEDVNIETRVVRDGLKIVGERKREAILEIEEGREVGGKRRRDGHGGSRRLGKLMAYK